MSRQPSQQDFATFFAAHQNPILGTATRMLRNREDAFDVLQEVAIRLYHHWHELDVAQNVDGWVYRTTVNECYRWLQRLPKGQISDDPALLDAVHHAEPQQENHLHAQQFQRFLGEALAELSEQERIAFVLRDLEQRSGQEIAECMGCQPATARGYYFSARKKLAHHITKLAPEWQLTPSRGGIA